MPASPGRKRGCIAARFLLAVLVTHNFHYTLGMVSNANQDCFKGYNQHPFNRLRFSPTKKWYKNFFEIKEEKIASSELIGWVFNEVAQKVPIVYSIRVDKNPNVTVFSIIETCGHVYVHHPIDREKTSSFSVYFEVHDRKANKSLAKPLNVIIPILDINDNAPQFSQREFNIIIKGNYHKNQQFYTITAFDRDQKGTANSEVIYSLISQKPQLKLPLFIIDSFSGSMSITQCLDYEANRNFRVLIVASDRGSPPMSSTATVNIAVEDSNNNLPVFTSKNYYADVPKDTTETDILRLKVEDKDSHNTSAWRAKYIIKTGNERGNFVVFTDSVTNEGVLRVVKPLVYGSLSVRRLVIVVENELPFFLCEGGLQPLFSEVSVSINITNQNYAPQFIPPVLRLEREEGVSAGTTLVQYMAQDSGTAQDKIRYKIGSDPSGWVTINEYYGIVTIAKTLVRESPLMNKTIEIHAIDDGIPPLTGTGTIQLYIGHSKLIIPKLTICIEKGMGPFPIIAEVTDSNSYAGSLTFQLEDASEDTQNLWKLGKSSGKSVELFMLKKLSPGIYLVPLRIRDSQGVFRQHTLNVQVCSCSDGIICGSTSVHTGLSSEAVIGITVAIFLLLILGLCVLLLYSCIFKAKKGPTFVRREAGNQSLIHYNEESERVLNAAGLGNRATLPSVYKKSWNEKEVTKSGSGATDMKGIQLTVDPPRTVSPLIYTLDRNTFKTSKQEFRSRWENITDENRDWLYWVNFWQNYNAKTSEKFLETVAATLKHKCKQINDLEDNIVSYTPHVYAEEGTLEKSRSLLSLLVPEDQKNHLPNNLLNDMGSIFDPLMKICSK